MSRPQLGKIGQLNVHEVWKHEERDFSNPAIRFELEAGPSEFGRRLKSVLEGEDSPRYEFRRRFWEDLFQ